MTPPPEPPRIHVLRWQPGLNGLRGAAIIAVLLYHAGGIIPPGRYEHWIAPGGYIGVDVFFVLSGFLITSLLLQEAQAGVIRVGRFYLRRALRLLPALVVLLAAVSAYDHAHGESMRTIELSLVAVGLYLTNWVTTLGFGVSQGLGQTWSLAVEEQFYLVWPLLLAIVVVRWRWPVRRQLIALALLCVGCGIYRAALWTRNPVLTSAYYRTDARFDALLIGAALSIAWRAGISLRWARPLAVPSAVLLVGAVLMAPTDPGWAFYGGFTVVAGCSAVLISAALQGSPPASTLLSCRPLQWLGDISYGVYLWHLLVLMVAQTLPGPWWLRAPGAVMGALLAGHLSRVLIERPFLALKDRIPVTATTWRSRAATAT